MAYTHDENGNIVKKKGWLARLLTRPGKESRREEFQVLLTNQHEIYGKVCEVDDRVERLGVLVRSLEYDLASDEGSGAEESGGVEGVKVSSPKKAKGKR